jgi:hypothetical protein
MSLVDSVAIQFAACKPPRRRSRNPGNAAHGAANDNVSHISILRIGFNHPRRAIIATGVVFALHLLGLLLLFQSIGSLLEPIHSSIRTGGCTFTT